MASDRIRDAINSFEGYWREDPSAPQPAPWENPPTRVGKGWSYDRRDMGYVHGRDIHASYWEDNPFVIEEMAVEAEAKAAASRGFKIPKVIRNNWKWMLGGAAAGAFLLKNLSTFSGKDDNYNVIEGLRHGGSAQDIRKRMTEFGSGWDKLRALVNTFGKGTGSFEKFAASSKFQKALKNATFVKKLGVGKFGETHLMETSLHIGGQEHRFQFARKQMNNNTLLAEIAENKLGIDLNTARQTSLAHEAKGLREFGHLGAPSFYGMDKHSLYMEAMEGQSASEYLVKHGHYPQKFTESLTEHMNYMHSKGYAHGDITRYHAEELPSNAEDFLNSSGEPGGKYGLHNVMITPEGNAAVLDYGTMSHAEDVELNIGGLRKSSGLPHVWTATRIEQRSLKIRELDNLAVHGAMQTTKYEQLSLMRRTASMATAQINTIATMAKNALTGGRRSKSMFVAAGRKTPTK